SSPLRCEGADARRSALPCAGPKGQDALSDARRQEHWAKDRGRARAQSKGQLEDGLLLARSDRGTPYRELGNVGTGDGATRAGGASKATCGESAISGIDA